MSDRVGGKLIEVCKDKVWSVQESLKLGFWLWRVRNSLAGPSVMVEMTVDGWIVGGWVGGSLRMMSVSKAVTAFGSKVDGAWDK